MCACVHVCVYVCVCNIRICACVPAFSGVTRVNTALLCELRVRVSGTQLVESDGEGEVRTDHVVGSR